MGKKLINLLTLVGCFFLFGVKPITAKQLPIVAFVNHVRGPECCDAGSLTNFQTQLETFAEQELPAFFALRYDALIDPEYQNLIKKYQKNPLFKFGVMLEITPNLAKKSFVTYDAEPQNWYQAQHAFLIGYEQEDRLALIDTLMASYQKLFKIAPEFSTAWQVDTFSLNYLKRDYGLKMHQLAREQWGLDSYTLDGGPPHYPYLASENWAFIPDFASSENLLIIRHTVNDPLYSYGDNSSAFTSQPNDYSLDKKDFGYFEKLIDQALSQTQQPGYINLGLENSMAQQFQLEYQKQIAKIKEYANQDRVEVTNNIDQIKEIYAHQPITIHAGSNKLEDNRERVYWITTPKYRLRLRFNQTEAKITDLRVYHSKLTDPYWEKTAQNKGYLIAPYLINAGINFPNPSKASLAQQLLGIPMISSFLATPIRDLGIATNSLDLPPVTDFNSIAQPSLNTISYLSQGRTITLSFNQETIDLQPLQPNDLSWTAPNINQYPVTFSKTQTGGELAWNLDSNKASSTNWQCQKLICHFEFDLNPSYFATMIEQQYPFIFPEKKPRNLSQEKTVVYAHNRYALAGRNPVRIVIVPEDEHGFPTSTQAETQVQTNPAADVVRVETQTASREYQFVDISHNQPAAIDLNLSLDNLTLPKQTIYFAPNCKKEPFYCALHPQQAWWFIRATIEDKMRLKLLGENQK